MRLDQLDLKHLRVLLVLTQTRNTYRAAEQLHLSQSAVSRTLAKLRLVLDDPVFIRSPGGLQPTALTERLAARLPEVLDLLEDAVDEGAGFDPRTWTGEFSLAMASHVTHGHGHAIQHALRQAAPGVTWDLRDWNTDTGDDLLEGRMGMGIHLFSERRDQSLYQHPLAADRFVLLARSGHPLVGREVHRDHFSRYGVVSLLLPDWNEFGNVLETRLAAEDIEVRVNLRVESLALALDCVRSSDSLMAGTSRLAERNEGLVALKIPPSLDVPSIPNVLCYPRRLRSSVRYQWLTETIIKALKVTAPEG